MRYISLFAGIGGFDLALNRLGHTCVYANDFDRYAAITYNKNFTHKIDTTSITDVAASTIPRHDLLVGGFPCQAFSIAGKRRGFEEARGTLFFDIARILKHHQTKYFILENVKGLLSHDSGRTFRVIVNSLTELGYDLQWQVCNSKNFGVPQNRERVFIVGNLRGQPRPKVFPLREGNTNDIEQLNQPTHSNKRIYSEGGISPTLNTAQGGNRQPKIVTAPTIRATEYKHGDNQAIILEKDMKIRRLTPIECERLQGFPDGWTAGVSDTQRYKQIGNAVTINVVYEIARLLTDS